MNSDSVSLTSVGYQPPLAETQLNSGQPEIHRMIQPTENAAGSVPAPVVDRTNKRPITKDILDVQDFNERIVGAYNDGSAELGLPAIALTDHDTMAGVAEAQAAGRAIGVHVVPGIELSIKVPHGSMHLLGYFDEPAPEPLAGLIAGFAALWISKWNVPQWFRGLMPVVVIPLLASLIVGLLMFLLLGRPLAELRGPKK